jgi:hypothetical protein
LPLESASGPTERPPSLTSRSLPQSEVELIKQFYLLFRLLLHKLARQIMQLLMRL